MTETADFMTEIAKKLKSQVLQLPSKDRAELAYCLLASLEEGREDEPGVESAWEAELERRWQEMESGADAGLPAENVFTDLRKKYP
jgi:putative addiction module component (TIGR02574 family)